MLTHVIVFDVK
jgi:hypothetical protein